MMKIMPAFAIGKNRQESMIGWSNKPTQKIFFLNVYISAVISYLSNGRAARILEWAKLLIDQTKFKAITYRRTPLTYQLFANVSPNT